MFSLFKSIFGSQKVGDLSQNESSTTARSNEELRMVVDDVFFIEGRGLVLTGRIESGEVFIGQAVKISSLPDKHVLKSIEMFNKRPEKAVAGENAGLLFEGLSKEQVSKGDVISG